MHSFTILIEMRLWGAVVGCGELGGVGLLQADMGEVITSLNKLFHIVVRVAYFSMFFIQQIIIKYVYHQTVIVNSLVGTHLHLRGYPVSK